MPPARITWPTLAVDTTEGAWRANEQRVLDFLDLSSAPDEPAGVARDLAPFVGSYRSLNGAPPARCPVSLEGDSLLLDGMPEVWPRTRLIEKASGVFEVASLPIEIGFAGDVAGTVNTMSVTGPEFLGGGVT